MTTDLWLPQGVTSHQSSSAGNNAETGGSIEQHIFQVHDPVTDKKHKFVILADDETSQAHLEDMVSSAVNKWFTEVRAKDHKPAPTPEQRKEIGKILNDIRSHNIKRRESTNNTIYYKGLEGAKNGRNKNNGRRLSGSPEG
jgi:hypothetical protein